MSEDNPNIAFERIAREAMDFADYLKGKHGEDAIVGTIMVLADVSIQVDDEVLTVIEYGCSDVRRWVQSALLGEALETAEESNVRTVGVDVDDEDDE